MSPAQQKALNYIIQIAKDAGLIPNLSKNVFQKTVSDKGMRIPWKFLETYLKENGNYDLSPLVPKDLTKLAEKKKDPGKSFGAFKPKQCSRAKEAMDAPRITVAAQKKETNAVVHEEKPISQETPRASNRQHVFIVQSYDSSGACSFVGVRKNFDGAWELRKRALNDFGKLDIKEARKQIESSEGIVRIQSQTCKTLWCTITKEVLI